ncbi:SRPBCC family protein [Seleniivibrio sp.]|uniref:SRPBCC family protein n=1 Tax=Seleniivibrio sp. TaxID=2898801 RepID=UPI0025D50B00|nr:SRPBCC family protein [Seleniivibrio sp.]MCD8553719.1 SRPBCC family protein [Seleniivibrio sp.]
MKAQKLERIQFMNVTAEKAWDFFSSPMNLAEITPPWLDFRVMSEVPEKMYEGMMVQYKVHPLAGLPIWWVTEITHVNEPYFFVDEQRKGPYRLWHHEHHFKEQDGGVLMTDIVHYILPLSAISQPFIGWYVARKLDAIFDYRANMLKHLFL